MEENQAPETEENLSNKEVVSSLKKRNWKSYFKEFFMLFLAISLGFFVENQREAYVENKSANVLSQSMLEDLEQNRKALQEAIRFTTEKDTAIEKLLEMLHAPRETWDPVAFYKSMTLVFITSPRRPNAYGTLRTLFSGIFHQTHVRISLIDFCLKTFGCLWDRKTVYWSARLLNINSSSGN